MKKNFTALFLIGLASLSACKKDSNKSTATNNITKVAPDGFTFATSKNVNLSVTLLSNGNQPVAGVVVSFYLPDNTSADAAVFKGVTDASGNLKGTVTIPASYSKIVIDPAYTGLLRFATAAIEGSNKVTATIGGSAGYSGDIVADPINSETSGSTVMAKIAVNNAITTDYVYVNGSTTTSGAVLNTSTYPLSLGRPNYLEATSDVIPASMLSYINASLPEGQNLALTHAQYLTGTSTLNINKTTDVYFTFVSEGAGYQSAIGFYTYQTGNPPTTGGGAGTFFGGIDKIQLILPNASSIGSGGGLKSGDKVKLGTFSAGTSIGFVLLQNAWTGNGVNLSGQKFYSDNSLNPETSGGLKSHTALLYDDVHNVYLVGMEDCNRQSSNTNPSGFTSDNDFNDVVFYLTTTTSSAVSNTGVNTIDKGGDTDGDGVQDTQDAFPTDPTRAYISYYPSQSTFANIAFEDNWPNKGDYDMNDLVVQYRYKFISNAANQVVSMAGNFGVAAAGASFKNGFGVQLPVSASAVASVTGQKLSSGTYISLASNGVEAGQNKAVIIPFDTHDQLVHNPDYSFFINTLTTKDKVASDSAVVTVNFASPVAASTLTATALNPFLISNMRRSYEAHLPGYAPTDKADAKLLGTSDDNSNAAIGRYYQAKDNMPWAINFTGSFSYPTEQSNINQAYLHFADWASSGGTSFTDWYSNTAAGYRNSAYIYTK
jgi:LruC domain-containing protein